MFTGIIEEVGTIQSIRPIGKGARITLACKKILQDLKLGESVCVSGVCLTAVEIGTDTFVADISEETLKRTYLYSLSGGAPLNLERALTAQNRLGGHLVNGHVDGIGKVVRIPPGSGEGDWTFSIPEELENYVVEKGSIAIDGISLTVSGLTPGHFKVAIIPTTLKETALREKKVGAPVNLEVDLLAKYVEKLLGKGSPIIPPRSLESLLNEYEYL